MTDKLYCMSSFLAYRYIVDKGKDFLTGMKHRCYEPVVENKIPVHNIYEIDDGLRNQFNDLSGKRIGLMLSGGMDSAILASYLPNCNAYTLRFDKGRFQSEELERAENYAFRNGLHLQYIDIDWEIMNVSLFDLMKHKGSPVHSIEPQIAAVVEKAKKDSIEIMVIGDAADYVFIGMDQLYSQDWKFEDFICRYMYINPKEVLKEPVDVTYIFKEYRQSGDAENNYSTINYMSFLERYLAEESYGSYENAFSTYEMEYIDPYEVFELADSIDLKRIRSGESKYLIRELFKLKYPDLKVPEKNPMPRMVDQYLKNWQGPMRREFKKHLNMTGFSGDQKWLMYCLESFLNYFDV